MSGAITAIVPVTPARLSTASFGVPAAVRSSLLQSFARDVLEAVAASAEVRQLVVVTAERQLWGFARRLGGVVLADRPLLWSDGFDEAVELGRSWAAQRFPHDPMLVVPAALPALNSAVLDETVGLMRAHHLAAVPDRSGFGTTIRWSRRPGREPRASSLGEGATAARRRVHIVHEADPRAWCDVNSAASLMEARRLGVGTHTLTALELGRADLLASELSSATLMHVTDRRTRHV